MLLDAIPDIHMTGRARTPVQGEVPNPLNPPTRLHLPPALPACQRALPRRAAGAAGDRGRAGRLPRGRGRADLSRRRGVGAAQRVGQQVLAARTGRRPSRARGSARPRSPTTITSAARGRRVVVAGHAHAVGAGGQHREQVARLRRASARSRPSQSPRFADRADDVVASRRAVARARTATMRIQALVHRRPHQVVHRRVDDAEVLVARRA